MASNINGFNNEREIIQYLNNRRCSNLNDNMKEFLKFIFPYIQNDSIIHAQSGISGQKPDILISLNNNLQGVSIKIGSGNSVHQESITSFMNFLNSLNISEQTKIELLKFHWGDGTIDGTGRERISGADYKARYFLELEVVNNELNKPDNLIPIIDRFLFQGKDPSFQKANYIYYGEVDYGEWASRTEILNYIINHNFESRSVHFGPLNYQIWNRCLNFNPNTENRRNVMQIKWSSLFHDLKYIKEMRNGNV